MRCLQPHYVIEKQAEIGSAYDGYSIEKAGAFSKKASAQDEKPKMFHSREEAERELSLGHTHGKLCEVRCRDCATCLMQHSRNWAIRMDHESRLYRDRNTNLVEGEFMCLTYRPGWEPKHGLLPGRRDLAEFRENLNDAYPNTKFSWLGCGEYGERKGRVHHHMVLLGKRWSDKHRYEISKTQSRHPELEEIWPYGDLRTEFIRDGSAAGLYVANYTLKGHEYHVDGRSRRRNQKAAKSRAPAAKLAALRSDYDAFERAFKSDPANTFLNAEDVYETRATPRSWEQVERETRPFISPQSKPGLGIPWLEKYWPYIYPEDSVTIGQGKHAVKVAPPPAYDRWIRNNHPKVWDQVLEQREEHRDETPIESPDEIEKRSKFFAIKQAQKQQRIRDHEV